MSQDALTRALRHVLDGRWREVREQVRRDLDPGICPSSSRQASSSETSGGAIANLGTARHHAAYLPGMLDGSLLGCFAMTETGRGCDVQDLHTTARTVSSRPKLLRD